MFENNEELRELQRSMTRKKDIETEVEDLRKKQKTMKPQVAGLKKIAKREQKDVRRLDGGSITALFYHVTGKLDERLETERREAGSAQAKYESAARELEELELRLQELTWELADSAGCEVRYEQLLMEKCASIKASGGPDAEKILGKERTLTFLRGQERQVLEAIAAGKTAFTAANSVLDCLDSAAGWGTWDMMGDGLMVHMTKREKMDEAWTAVKAFQEKLELFKGKLANTSVRTNLQFMVDGMLRWTDGILEGFFTELAALDRLNQAKEQAVKFQNQTRQILEQLDNLLETTRKKQAKTKDSMEKMIVSMD